jgi:LPS sulfotransferase NodH
VNRVLRVAGSRLSPALRKRVFDAGFGGQATYAPFVVVGRSRVGSNLLRGLLNAHPAVVSFGEVFRDVASFDWDHTGYFQSGAMRALLARDPAGFVDGKVFGRYPRWVRAVGFKLFYYHARQAGFARVWDYVESRRDLRIIHVKRRNILQTHLSRRRAALSDRWVDTSGKPGLEPPVTLDYEEVRRDFEQTRAWEETADRAFARHPLLPVHYEQLAADRAGEVARLQEFLGLAPHPAEPATFRQATRPLSAAIANYDELKDRFRGTPWAAFFAD